VIANCTSRHRSMSNRQNVHQASQYSKNPV
jgi:hypothetical protein